VVCPGGRQQSRSIDHHAALPPAFVLEAVRMRSSCRPAAGPTAFFSRSHTGSPVRPSDTSRSGRPPQEIRPLAGSAIPFHSRGVGMVSPPALTRSPPRSARRPYVGAVLFGRPIERQRSRRFRAPRNSNGQVPMAQEKPFLGICLWARDAVTPASGARVDFLPMGWPMSAIIRSASHRRREKRLIENGWARGLIPIAPRGSTIPAGATSWRWRSLKVHAFLLTGPAASRIHAMPSHPPP